jgi:uncharacterized protein (DUF486 family)
MSINTDEVKMLFTNPVKKFMSKFSAEGDKDKRKEMNGAFRIALLVIFGIAFVSSFIYTVAAYMNKLDMLGVKLDAEQVKMLKMGAPIVAVISFVLFLVFLLAFKPKASSKFGVDHTNDKVENFGKYKPSGAPLKAIGKALGAFTVDHTNDPAQQ